MRMRTINGKWAGGRARGAPSVERVRGEFYIYVYNLYILITRKYRVDKIDIDGM